MSRVEAAAASNGISIWEAAQNIRTLEPEVKEAAARKLTDFVALISDMASQITTMEAYDLALNVATKSGVIHDLRQDKTNEGVSKLENLEELLNSIREFTEEMKKEDENDEALTLDRFLETVSLLTDADKDKPEDRDKVTIMTVHSAKGLEFKYVYLVGLEEELFPSRMSMGTEQELEEERRLFYVAITRAERRATISYAMQRYRWGSPTSCRPSRFLKEIDESYLDMTAQDSEVQENTTTNTDAEKKIAENEQPKIAGPSLEEQLAESKDRYLRLSAEFDNFRKRSRKEREDLIKTAGESVITELLHVVDDYDRALKSIDQATDIQAIKEGIQLISNKFEEFLKRQGVTEIDAIGHELNTDLHEAITKIPSPDENAKGKVVEVIQKGYMLNEKVIRYSKVIVGE